MMIPGCAPFTPHCHDPSVVFTLPRASSSAVASPRYQTLPPVSCAYQSLVRSSSLPSK